MLLCFAISATNLKVLVPLSCMLCRVRISEFINTFQSDCYICDIDLRNKAKSLVATEGSCLLMNYNHGSLVCNDTPVQIGKWICFCDIILSVVVLMLRCVVFSMCEDLIIQINIAYGLE